MICVWWLSIAHHHGQMINTKEFWKRYDWKQLSTFLCLSKIFISNLNGLSDRKSHAFLLLQYLTLILPRMTLVYYANFETNIFHNCNMTQMWCPLVNAILEPSLLNFRNILHDMLEYISLLVMFKFQHYHRNHETTHLWM